MKKNSKTNTKEQTLEKTQNLEQQTSSDSLETTEEIGGPKGPEPTRYLDWERKGKCVDF